MPKIQRHLPWWTYGGYLDPKSPRPQKGMRGAQTQQWWQAAQRPQSPLPSLAAHLLSPPCSCTQSPGLLSFPWQLWAHTTTMAAGLSQFSQVRHWHQGLHPNAQTSHPPAPLPQAPKAWLPNPRIKHSWRKVTWTWWLWHPSKHSTSVWKVRPSQTRGLAFTLKLLQTAGFTLFWVPIPLVLD